MNAAFTKKKPEKRLLVFLKKNGGRSSSGRITVRHQGGGVKRLYRLINFGQEKLNVPGKVIAIEYDPNRTAHIALVEYEGGDKRYILKPKDVQVGDAIVCADIAPIKAGNRLKLKNIPIGTEIHNIEFEPGRGGKMVRGAGGAATVVAQEGKFTHLEMPSGEVRKIYDECFASVGRVSNETHAFENVRKAGIMRLRGIRPTVRGTVMNPVDHPHGGGNGKTMIGMRAPKTPWGKPARGVKTRSAKWSDKMIIKRRTKKKR